MEIDEHAIDADIRGRVEGIDLERSDAAAKIWALFLEHARRPLNWGEHFDDDHGNDQVSSRAARAPDGGHWTVNWNGASVSYAMMTTRGPSSPLAA
jgi:hypothetical protein